MERTINSDCLMIPWDRMIIQMSGSKHANKHEGWKAFWRRLNCILKTPASLTRSVYFLSLVLSVRLQTRKRYWYQWRLESIFVRKSLWHLTGFSRCICIAIPIHFECFASATNILRVNEAKTCPDITHQSSLSRLAAEIEEMISEVSPAIAR